MEILSLKYMACIAGWLINDHMLSPCHFWTLWEQVLKVKFKSSIWHSFGEWPSYWQCHLGENKPQFIYCMSYTRGFKVIISILYSYSGNKFIYNLQIINQGLHLQCWIEVPVLGVFSFWNIQMKIKFNLILSDNLENFW